MTEFPRLKGDEPCRDAPDLFFPEPGQNFAAELARQLCRRCPTRVPCARYAVAQSDDLHGIWGGLSPKERKKIRRKRVDA